MHKHAKHSPWLSEFLQSTNCSQLATVSSSTMATNFRNLLKSSQTVHRWKKFQKSLQIFTTADRLWKTQMAMARSRAREREGERGDRERSSGVWGERREREADRQTAFFFPQIKKGINVLSLLKRNPPPEMHHIIISQTIMSPKNIFSN